MQQNIVAMNQDIIRKADDYVRTKFENDLAPEYTYHNYKHTLAVKEAAEQLLVGSELSDDEQEILYIAVLFHDIGFTVSNVAHEESGKKIAEGFLANENYPQEKIIAVKELIEATRKEHEPQNELEKIICDADLSGLAHANHSEKSKKLRQEWALVNGQIYTDLQWHKINYKFMKEHEYYTEKAKALYGPEKEKNLAQLKEIIDSTDHPFTLKKKKKKKKQDLGVTISSSKSAQTQFKTALRNHIDLSAIADNKANIMLSVNALIITVALPFMAGQVVQNKNLLIPAIVLLVVCVTSMIYATLATRPIKMSGQVSQEQIDNQQSNLFFFGNFYKMSFLDYEKGMMQVVSNPNTLDNAITRDLFFLGKALGSKYRNLRLCYNIFMYGMIIAVIGFVIAFSISPVN